MAKAAGSIEKEHSSRQMWTSRSRPYPRQPLSRPLCSQGLIHQLFRQ